MFNLIKNNIIQFDKLIIEKYFALNLDETDTIILIRLNDNENKWVIAPEGINFTDEEIILKTAFQERFYKTVLVR